MSLPPLRVLAVYLPSLLSRYSTQVLVISIPWLLQGQGVGLAEISAALLPFYAGSLVFSALASWRAPAWNVPRALMAVLVLQGLFSLLCLLTGSVAWLAVFRFLQGAATGVSRPLAQLWALECEAGERSTPERKMQVNVFVQVAIAAGMAMGSYVGVMLGREAGGVLVVTAVVLLPVAVACASVWRLDRRLPARRASGVEAAQDATREPLRAAVGPVSAGLVGAFLVFFASMAAYNIWPVLIPFALRSRALPELLAVLTLALAVQPLLFGIAQLAIAAALRRFAVTDRFLLALLLASHLASLLAVSAGAAQDHPGLFLVAFLAGTGLAVGAIYPVASLLLMRHVERLPASHRQASQRRLVFLFGLAGDLGQLVGGGLLAWDLFPHAPLDLLWLPALLALPALACHRRTPRMPLS